MAVANSQTNNAAINFNDPYFLSNGDHPGMQLGTHVLNGSNFLNWSRAVKMALIAQNKLQFVDGSLPMPATDSADYQKWLRNDYMVMSWSLNSMEKVKTNLLGSGLLPHVHKAYYTLQQVEQQNKLNSAAVEVNALQAMKVFHKPMFSGRKDFKKQKNDVTCQYCEKRDHIIDQCFQLYGFLDWWNRDKGVAKLVSDKPASLPSTSRFSNNVNKENQTAGILGKAPSDASSPGVDPVITSAVYKQVIQMMQNRGGSATGVSGSSSASEDNPLSSAELYFPNTVNFAGTISAFSATSLMKSFDHTSWNIDTGATNHMVSNLALFDSIEPFRTHVRVSLLDGTVKSDSTTKKMQAEGTRVSGLYIFSSIPCSVNGNFASAIDVANNFSSSIHNTITSSCTPSLNLIHARLGHALIGKLRHVSGHAFGNINKNADFSCEACVLRKHHKFPFELSDSHALASFDLIHIDLWGKYKRPSLTSATYFLTILDDHTGVTWTYLIHAKTQVFSVISSFFEYVNTQFGKKIKMIRSDNGTEIIQESCASLFASIGALHHKSFPGVPEQNRRVERKHRHLLEIASTLRLYAGLSFKFWVAPTYDHLRVLGCLAYPNKKTLDKFAPRSSRCMFIGYPFGQKGYKFYDLETHKIILSRDAYFVENSFPFKDKTSMPVIPNSVSPQLVNPALDCSNPLIVPSSSSSDNSFFNSSSNFIPIQPSIPVRTSSRTCKNPDKFKGFILANPSHISVQELDIDQSASFNVHTEPTLAHLSVDNVHSLSMVLTAFEPSSYNQSKEHP
ncbi:uncharacterized protein LOC110717489 [Chenopodium quinoa]|uniref:uncharacterized protein LOC110717489 n=1 Tax=Chenopodium quinoa TaxID=63459 RepID=UPI000B77F8C4|nr:uncharacterized protein LOC110717489 [Chenopodium quinoa]